MGHIEKSLILIKPDAVERHVTGKIIDIYESNGLRLIAIKMIKVDEELAKTHYAEHSGKIFFDELIRYITRSPLIAAIFEGQNAIEKIRKLNGNTNPEMAEYGTIRKKFGVNKTENSVHSSDCAESAEKEINLWFPEIEQI
jgi:nucleoside-diphosphate kinase